MFQASKEQHGTVGRIELQKFELSVEWLSGDLHIIR